MSFNGFVLTVKGLEYLTKSTVGQTLAITKGKFGSGALPDGTAASSLTDLITPLGTLPIEKQRMTGSKVVITTQFSNKVNGSILPEFHLMEVGLFGKMKNADGTDDTSSPETLIIYANAKTTEKADNIEAILTEFLINFNLIISGSQNIACVIDESLVYPTKEEFNERAPYQVTGGGTGAAITMTIEDMDSLKDGTTVILKLPADLQDNATASCNGSAAYPIYNLDGTPAKAGALEGTYIMIVYSSDDQCWYIIGDGGAGAKGSGTLVFFDKVVATTEWAADETYAEYPYAANISCTDVTSDYSPEVTFDVPDAVTGKYAPVAKTGAGVVIIYAKSVPEAALTIPLITCEKVVFEE